MTARSRIPHAWETHQGQLVLVGGSGQQRYALFLRMSEIKVRAQSGKFQATLHADRCLNREPKHTIQNTDGGTIVSFSRLGLQPLTLSTQLSLKKD